MTFFSRFEADILAGKKTITIRDESEKDYHQEPQLKSRTLEEGRVSATEILSVEPIAFSALNQFHAEQENMTLETLKEVIQEIYPGIEQLYVIQYQRV
ncbi:ASCH domain-containing protein [Vibrio sp. 03_296]|uniref:N(4)-acetylcytidine aminohydrolase n=1 Tax=Vibrio sp. 03_296 TaxID=2024409 RepID=UPI000BD1EC1C|nr:ASCH domain-containing protein [Vibrio sp. 03_296]